MTESGKSGEKWWKVGKSGKNWLKVAKSGQKWRKVVAFSYYTGQAGRATEIQYVVKLMMEHAPVRMSTQGSEVQHATARPLHPPFVHNELMSHKGGPPHNDEASKNNRGNS